MIESIEIDLAGKSGELVLVAQNYSVINDESLSNAVDLIGQMKATFDQIEKQRDGITRPLFEAQRECNAQFKAVTGPLKAAEDGLRAGILNYQKRERMRQEEEERERQRIAKEKQDEYDRKMREREQEMAKAEPEAEPPPPPEPPPVETAPPEPVNAPIHGNYGSKAKIKEKWEYKVLDVSQVPLRFLMVDEKAVKEAIKAGERNIQGLGIYDAGVVAVR